MHWVRLTWLVTLLCLGGCKVYDSSLIEEGSAGVPARPPQSTSSSADEVEATFALFNLSLDHSGERWRRLGFDLDQVNTGSIDDEAECVAANGRPPLDGDNGIDNAFGQHVLPTLVNVIACMEDEIALNQARGRGTILLRVRDWNGTANDANVDVSVFSAVDGTSKQDVTDLEWAGPDGASLVEAGTSNEAPQPSWAGEDRFFVDPSSLIADDLDRPNIWQSDAYISKGRIVLPLDTSAAFLFPTQPGSLRVSINGFLVADLSADGQTISKGLIAGRASAGELVSSLSSLGVCEQSFQDSIVALITDNLDLRVDPEAGNPGDPCTATGLSFAFQGVRANIAAIPAPVALPVPDPCATPTTSGLQPAFGRCCKSVQLNSPELLPEDCSSGDLAVYESLPVPVPVPAMDDF